MAPTHRERPWTDVRLDQGRILRNALHVPAGRDLGGKAPGEIALSVVAEIVAESYERPGGSMRGLR